MMDEASAVEQDVVQESQSDQDQDSTGTGGQGIRDYLTPDLQLLLEKELDILGKERSQELALLKKDLATEGKFVKEWGFPTDCSYEGCGHDIATDAKCWLEKQKHDLEEQIEGLIGRKETIQAEVDKQKGDIAALEESLKSLIDEWKAFPDAVKEAWETVQDLEEKLKQPNLGDIKKGMLQEELDAAKAKLNDLCSNDNLEKPEDCTPAAKHLPHQAISDTLKRWRKERSRLRELVALSEGFLFSIGSEYQSDLEAGELSLTFRQTFEGHGITLSRNLTIEKPVEGSRWWRIKENDTVRTFIVSEEGEALQIYASGGISLEDIEVKIKQAQKHLEFAKTYEEVLIAMRAKELFDELPEIERPQLPENGKPCGCQSL
jgi:hypothetical protein